MRSSARGCSPLVRSETTQKQPDAASGCSASQSATTGGTRIEVAPSGICLVYSSKMWMVFKKKFLYLDQTRLRYQISVTTGQGAVNISITQISYLYNEEWEENKPTGTEGERYRAEEWITDEKALNKKGTKVLPMSGKFRRKTIDRMNEIFENAMDMFETKAQEEKAKEEKAEKVQKRQFVVE